MYLGDVFPISLDVKPISSRLSALAKDQSVWRGSTVIPDNYPDCLLSSLKLCLSDPNYLNNRGDNIYYN